MKPRRPECLGPRSGYYGLERLFMGYVDLDAQGWRYLWRLYCAAQPIRCLFGWHRWYSTAAGECSACANCKASGNYPTDMMHEYRWRPWVRPLAAEVRELEMQLSVWRDALMILRIQMAEMAEMRDDPERQPQLP